MRPTSFGLEVWLAVSCDNRRGRDALSSAAHRAKIALFLAAGFAIKELFLTHGIPPVK